jgi:hypothetical protein
VNARRARAQRREAEQKASIVHGARRYNWDPERVYGDPMSRGEYLTGMKLAGRHEEVGLAAPPRSAVDDVRYAAREKKRRARRRQAQARRAHAMLRNLKVEAANGGVDADVEAGGRGSSGAGGEGGGEA